MKKRIRQFIIGMLVALTLVSTVPITYVTPQATIVEAATTGQKNALRKAKLYLSVMPFSKKGLRKQLEFDGFSSKEAKYGVNHCGANWKKQAYKKAKQYLDIMAYSKQGLIDQLLFDGFTKKQAKYAVKRCGF